jgi:hypothetical protein
VRLLSSAAVHPPSKLSGEVVLAKRFVVQRAVPGTRNQGHRAGIWDLGEAPLTRVSDSGLGEAKRFVEALPERIQGAFLLPRPGHQCGPEGWMD